MKTTKKPTVLLERFPYRYIQVGKLETNGMPDCRIQKVDSYTGRYRDMYLCDNEMQLMTAMEDFEYTKWLDPDNVPCYVKDSVSSKNQPWSVKVPLQSRSHGETLKILVESLDPLMSLRHLSNDVGADGGNTPALFLASG